MSTSKKVDFPKIGLVEPVLENLTRVLDRDLPEALKILSGETTPASRCGYLEKPAIYQGRPMVPVSPAIHMLWLDGQFDHKQNSLDQKWRIAIEVFSLNEDPNCGAIELMRYMQAISWVIARAQKCDLWATEPKAHGLGYIITLDGWDAPDAFEAHGDKLVKRGRVLITVQTFEKLNPVSRILV
jgi:hypothetical protein